MPPPRYDRSIYDMTPPRELDEEHGMKAYTGSRENSSTIDKEVPTDFDPENVSDVRL